MSKNFISKLAVGLCGLFVSWSVYSQDASEYENVIVQNQELAAISEVEMVVDTKDARSYTIRRVTNQQVEERLRGLENIMPMPYNEHVQRYIDYFLFKRPSFVREMLEKKERYFPVFDKYLSRHGIPREMKYLALLESGLNPNAVSRANAVGMWQFMSFTGKEMGLRINDYMDERRHVEKATNASFIYLTQLYNQFNDWELALAAYNSGPGRVKRAIRRSGGLTDYWSLHNYLPSDTRAYVPQWEALNYLMNYAADHGIYPDTDKLEYPINSETLLLNGYLNLEVFAALNNLSVDQLKNLNPHLTKTEIPAYATNVEVEIPLEKYDYFAANKSFILDSASKFNRPVYTEPENHQPYHLEYVTVKKYHKVRRGEHLNLISDRYGVSVSDLRKWNNLRSSKILVGQRLVMNVKETRKIYHNTDSTSETPEEETVLAEEETEQKNNIITVVSNSGTRSNVKIASQREQEVNVIEEIRPVSSNAKPSTRSIKKYYKVRKGENLITIAKNLGVSVTDMKKWNNLRNANDIYYGFNLIYYKTVTEASSNASGVKFYTVQRGDTLWSIAQRYPHVSMEQIKKLNNLSGNTVKVGQKLKIGS